LIPIKSGAPIYKGNTELENLAQKLNELFYTISDVNSHTGIMLVKIGISTN